jgi:hypothetical protein
LSPFKTLKEMEDLKKGIKSYITHFSATMEDGGEEYWLPKITYWENVLKALDVPLVNQARPRGSFWKKKRQESDTNNDTQQ